MRTRHQYYATEVLGRVQLIKEQGADIKSKYGIMAHKLPVLIRKAGLAQALGFAQSKSKKEGIARLLQDLSEVVDGDGDLCEHSRNARLPEYVRLTNNVLSALLWFKRFAVSVLEVEGDEGDTDE